MTDLNARWIKLRTVKFDDADFAVAATTATIDTGALVAPAMGTDVMILDVLIHERTQFAIAASTLALDIGTAGTLEELAKDVALESASGTDTLGSATTSVKPRLIKGAGYVPRLTFTSSSGDLSTTSAGAVDIYALVGAAPRLN